MRLVKDYLRVDKDSVYDKQDERGLSDEQRDKLRTALYEVEFLVDVDSGTIFTVNGKILDTAEDYDPIGPGELDPRGQCDANYLCGSDDCRRCNPRYGDESGRFSEVEG